MQRTVKTKHNTVTQTSARASRPIDSSEAASRPSDTVCVLSRATRSLDCSVQNRAALKKQTLSETVKVCTDGSEKKKLSSVVIVWRLIKNYVGSLKNRSVQRAEKKMSTETSPSGRWSLMNRTTTQVS